MNNLILKEIKITKAGTLLHHRYNEINVIEIKVEEPPVIGKGNLMFITAQHTTKLYEGTNDYQICKELIDTEDRTLAFLNINNLNFGIRLIARKILDI